MTTGLFHADPHRGNLLKTSDGKLAFIDFGMMADIDEEDRYGLFGLLIGLQNKDLPLVTENLLKVRNSTFLLSMLLVGWLSTFALAPCLSFSPRVIFAAGILGRLDPNRSVDSPTSGSLIEIHRRDWQGI